MRKLFFVLLVLALVPLKSCDDGDIIDFELDFDDTFKVCTSQNALVFYKTKNDPSETISLLVNGLELDDIFKVDENGEYTNTSSISASAPLNYRTYSNTSLPSNLFCNAIPSSEINITRDDVSTSGEVNISTVLVEDDNDSVPANLEDRNGNDNLEDDDTDGDGLPDYIDADDDGDNVLTKDESPDPNGDGDLSDALDTDGDGIPNYLDADDDGDGIDTRDEENDSQDQNPANDITTPGIADYLNKDIANLGTPAATAYREHTIGQTYTVTLTVSNFDLELISVQNYSFGSLNNGQTTQSRVVTPDFP